ncbi:phage tail protein [Pseudoalteromonas sp. A22]|uniref:phage tail protein n=1 Tax=Pseudoalteromonas TaxID=53246 RepID=UPI001BAB37F6|nr:MULTISPECIES: tail fiber protein [Pseudoalteromonas]QUI61230.1 phage tail protein [Pseudoalteromonas sp. A22]USE71307.1 phage tail protein [Pseudoalteromonas flavipulchra]
MTPFYGMIQQFACNFAPTDYAFCDGEIMQIQQHQALYSLLGSQFGGDARTTFALPDLRGRVPMHPNLGAREVQGAQGGSETVAITLATMPPHYHKVNVSSASGIFRKPNNNKQERPTVFASVNPDIAEAYTTAPSNPSSLQDTSLQTLTASPASGGQAHNNMQPSCVINFCIALDGLYPQRS